MRESVGLSANAKSLEWSEFSTKDIDRVTALAYAGKVSPLGADMYRLVIAGDAGALPRCMRMLSDKIRPKNKLLEMPLFVRTAIARQAISEVIEPHCRVCSGAGERRLDNGVLVVCVKCEGHGGHRHSDGERARGIGVDIKSYRPKISDRMDYALEVLSREIFVIGQQLRNWID